MTYEFLAEAVSFEPLASMRVARLFFLGPPIHALIKKSVPPTSTRHSTGRTAGAPRGRMGGGRGSWCGDWP